MSKQKRTITALLLCIIIHGIIADNVENVWSSREIGSDNRKPQIRNCKGYAPIIKEEQQHGTFVTKIEAFDPDKQDRIEFSFITANNERPKFKIDPLSGMMTTNHVFDRDEPAREKEVYVTVRVTDNGRPALDDVCTFKVTIEDINDNPPVFDKSKYLEPMPEDRQVNKVVTRISATDLDDGDNSIVMYELMTNKPNHHKYFRMDNTSGIIYLERPIDKKPGQFYSINVRAYNTFPDQSQQAETEIRIEVIESNKKAPTFVDPPNDPIILKENFNNFDKPLVTLSAISNVPEKPELIFELITGRTEQTNNKKTFVLTQNGNDASIYLGKNLDYESITDYSLTVTVRNSHDIITEHIIKIKVEDVNDNIPSFVEIDSGTILENEPPGTVVMQVRAIDVDATPPYNAIAFELADNTEFFSIDQQGIITAKVSFDREIRESYNVKVVATDGAPSALFMTGKHNVASQVFRIEIADKNDHPPKFKQDEYLADRVPEDANLNTLVIEVQAIDKDTASNMDFSIESGNINNTFKIESTIDTGRITINQPLDYEQITEYILRIKVFDGIYSDYATVKINIANVNDCPPEFFEDEYRNEILEEKLHEDCIVNIGAYDPDIKDRNLPQRIKYEVSKKEQREFLTINENGCLTNIKPLDRDKPNGQKSWQILVSAIDEDGQGLSATKFVTIDLIDINDNAPFLDMSMPVIWPENQLPEMITKLVADDYDERSTNGFHFDFELDAGASNDIKNKFAIQEGDQLWALTQFDREEQKEYFIPIMISDSGVPQQKNVSYLHLVIGDVNDNPMEAGESNIFVYNYKGQAPDTEIGRVFVEDPDDWDLPDKTFFWSDGPHNAFSLDENTGMITMLEGTRDGTYELNFRVIEESALIQRHEVLANVKVTIKEIPEEAVDKSGSIRFYDISAEKFIDENPISPKEKLRVALATLFNTSVENVDIFTVLKNGADSAVLDVRFSAHGSPYYEPEKLNGKIAQQQLKLEEELGMKMLMINIDECLIERAKCESSCYNKLEKSNVPLAVFTNRTSFVGVDAFVSAVCECKETRISGEPICYNGGTTYANTCECPKGYEGPSCEQISVGFTGNSWALYPPIDPCETTKISLELKPETNDGLIMYIGPMSYNLRLPVQDFLALEIMNGHPVLTVDYGTGSVRVHHNYTRLETGRVHKIEISLTRTGIEMTVDECKLSSCIALGAPQGKNEFLNANSPIHLGGSSVNLEVLGAAFNWGHVPSTRGYIGCIRNLTVNEQTYNLGQPSLSLNIDPGCEKSLTAAVTFGVANNFIYALIACIILLLILILAVVVHKKSYDGVSRTFLI